MCGEHNWCIFWDFIKCHRMHRVIAEWSKCVSTACLVEPCTGRVAEVRKIFSGVLNVWEHPLCIFVISGTLSSVTECIR